MESSKSGINNNSGAKEYQVKKHAASRSLMTYVFSWSISDILNKNLYKNKVPNIPLRFTSLSHYIDSYGPALIEETHADLFSGITSLSTAPVFQIISVEEHPKLWRPNYLLYHIIVKPWRRSAKVADKDPDDDEEVDAAEEEYNKPAGGDLIALTVVQPRRIDDLNSPGQPYTVALVDPNLNDGDKISVFTSKPIDCLKKYRHSKNGKKTMLFGVYLINMTTNLRIQTALSLVSEKRSNILKTIVVQGEHDAAERCPECLVDERSKTAVSTTNLILRSHSVNESQEAAILSCIASSQCKHQNTIKLIAAFIMTQHSEIKISQDKLTDAPHVLEADPRYFKRNHIYDLKGEVLGALNRVVLETSLRSASTSISFATVKKNTVINDLEDELVSTNNMVLQLVARRKKARSRGTRG